MNQEIGLYWVQEMLTATTVLAGPILIGALIIGLTISVLQAATTIQEMTLSYVPKMAVVVLILFFLFGFMISYIVEFTERIFDFVPLIAQ